MLAGEARRLRNIFASRACMEAPLRVIILPCQCEYGMHPRHVLDDSAMECLLNVVDAALPRRPKHRDHSPWDPGRHERACRERDLAASTNAIFALASRPTCMLDVDVAINLQRTNLGRTWRWSSWWRWRW